jgi:hypothetical protein
VSIHVYGGNIGAINRHAFASDGSRTTFVSGYSSLAGADPDLSRRRLLA